MISNRDLPSACIQIARWHSPSERHKHRHVLGRDCETARSAVPPYRMRTWEPLALCLWSEGSEESHLWVESPEFAYCARLEGRVAEHFRHAGVLPPPGMPQGWETLCQFCSSQRPARARHYLTPK